MIIDPQEQNQNWRLDARLPFVANLVPRDISPPAPRWGWKGTLKWLGVNTIMPVVDCLNDPTEHAFLYTSWGGMGDEVLHTAVLPVLAKKFGAPLWVLSLHPWVYRKHPSVKGVIPPDGHVISWAQKRGRLQFGGYPQARDKYRSDPLRHQISMICHDLSLRGDIELRPQIFLDEKEKKQKESFKDCILIHSSILGARYPSYNKQWPLDRMKEVVRHLSKYHRIVQIGNASDPPLNGAQDLRGFCNFRQLAAIFANAALFVGMEGFHTHLARSLNCRSVVIYGGYTRPDETGYMCNENLYTDLPCSPCWEPSGCDFNRKCLDVISASDVITAVSKALTRNSLPLESEWVHLPARI